MYNTAYVLLQAGKLFRICRYNTEADLKIFYLTLFNELKRTSSDFHKNGILEILSLESIKFDESSKERNYDTTVLYNTYSQKQTFEVGEEFFFDTA